jgi:GGDEF domain-containing protein
VRASAIADADLGINSYAYYQRRLEEEQARADRHRRPLTVLLMTVDDLAVVPAERRPELLRILVLVLRRALPESETVCRYDPDGGFAVILPETSAPTATVLAQTIESELRNFHFRPYSHDRELAFAIRVVPVREAPARASEVSAAAPGHPTPPAELPLPLTEPAPAAEMPAPRPLTSVPSRNGKAASRPVRPASRGVAVLRRAKAARKKTDERATTRATRAAIAKSKAAANGRRKATRQRARKAS